MKSGPSAKPNRSGVRLSVASIPLLFLASTGLTQSFRNETFDPGSDMRVFAHAPYYTVDFLSHTRTTGYALGGDLWSAPQGSDSILLLGSGRVVVSSGGSADPFRLADPYQPGSAAGLSASSSPEIFLVRVSPGVSANLGEVFQVAASLDFVSTDMSLSRTEQDRRLRLDSDGMGLQGNVGLTLNLTERQSLGVTYRSRLDIDSKDELPADSVAPAPVGGVFRSESKTRTKFPTILSAGYGIDLSRRFRLETDLSWLQFSKSKDLPFMVGNGLPAFPGSVNENWKDTFAVGIGTALRLGEHWMARAGYQYYKSPAPDSATSYSIPDAAQNFLTVSLGLHFGQHALEAAYGADFYDVQAYKGGLDRGGAESGASMVHLVSVAYRMVF